MAALAKGTITLQVSSAPGGDRNVSLSFQSADANNSIQQKELASGANTITVPTLPATSGVVIQLPSTNTNVVTLKGVGGDTGIAIGKTSVFVLNWDPIAPPTSFVLNSAAAQTGLITNFFFF